MNAEPRQLTVEPFHLDAAPEARGSQLRIKGRWLRALGFEPSDRVTVTLDNGALVIRKISNLPAA